MNIFKKIFLFCLLFTIIPYSFVNAQERDNSNPSTPEIYFDDDNINNIVIDDRSELDKQLELQKRNEALEYYNETLAEENDAISNSINKKAVTWSKLLNYNFSTTPQEQEEKTWCGPASVANARLVYYYNKDGSNVISKQFIASQHLGTSLISGTKLNSLNWTTTMDLLVPGNRYMVTFGRDFYNLSTWEPTMRANIKLSLDSGYPVVVNAQMENLTAFLNNNYVTRYANNGNKTIFHYVTLTGYGYENGELVYRFVDSASYSLGAFNVKASSLAKMTYPLGIIW